MRLGPALQGVDFFSMEALGPSRIINDFALVGQVRKELCGLRTVAAISLFRHRQSPFKNLYGINVIFALGCDAPKESQKRHEVSIIRSLVRLSDRDRAPRHRFGKLVIPLIPLQQAK